MSLFISSLNSGSNGNCYYVGNQDEAVLIDAGISCRETERRMKRLELSIKKIKAIFVTHEHGDHIYGIRTLAKKHSIPVYITASTRVHGRLQLQDHLVQSFRAYEPVRIGNLYITAFPKLHDASDPHSFVVACNEVRVGIFTDIGSPCEHVINHFKQCHAAFLEANYDERMLDESDYSYFLKNRIRGGYGHLSNTQALKIFTRHKPSYMSHLFLSHLSQNNNRPEIVEDLFKSKAGKTAIIVASRHRETPVYHISNLVVRNGKRMRLQDPRLRFQLSLFQ